WLCSAAHQAITATVELAKTRLLQLVMELAPSQLDNSTSLENFCFWIIPNSYSSSPNTTLCFIDIIKGLVPSSLIQLLLTFILSSNQIVSICSSWLQDIRIFAWQSIWLPRCD